MTKQPQNEQPQEQPEKKRQRRPKGRANGEGTVFKRSGKRKKPYVAEITLENRQQKTIGYFKTQEEAVAAKNKALRELEQGKLATGPKQTLKQYLELWLETSHKQDVELITYLRGKITLNKHIIPGLGHLQLKALKAQHVQQFYAQKLEEGLSAGYVKNMHDLLSKAIKNAVRWKLISFNIMEDVTPPRPEEREVIILTQNQAQELLKVAQEHDLNAFISLAITTGMRHGELLALRWHDIDFDEGCLHVRHTVNRQGGSGYIEGDPKTRKSRRRIILVPFVLEELKEHRRRQEGKRQEVGAVWVDKDLVFPNNQGKFLPAGTNLARFRKVLKAAGLPPMRVHDLRHNAGTLLMSKGINPKLVQELLGHSDISITLRLYGHVIPSMHGEAMNMWERFLNDKKESNDQGSDRAEKDKN
ncbi:MAG TPA: tyrosine-type recombinase/integrase [Ktedonobacteraceae bacterium]|nr:tyrosine-type recombinase/integrase [Ktedonobacteraceae bacterium]